MTMFRFGCGHVKLDEMIHEASWGARLIYQEIVETKGVTPVVWDRQTPDGEPESVKLLFPVIDRAINEFRELKYMPGLTSDGRGRLCWRDGRALVVMSPQGSYGYLYVTGVLEKVGHENETELAVWETNPLEIDQQYGNWPPEVPAYRAEKERKWAEDAIVWAERELKWAQDEVRRANSDRARTIRQKKADEAGRKLAELREKAGVA